MGGMNDNLGPNAHLDLSRFAAQAARPPSGGWVTEADERTFEQVLNRSMQHPLVVEFYSPRANAAQLSQDLAELADAAGGRYLLVRVNVDTSPTLAQALGIQAVPLVVGVLGGQVMPMFQGTTSKAEAEAVIGQLLQAAMANGIVGRADPVPGPVGEAQPEEDPRFADADAAMARGDFAGAVAEFDKILAQTPNDAEAIAGRAQVSLLARLEEVNAEVISSRLSDPDDLDAQLSMADMEVASANAAAGFARLVGIVARTAGEDRDRVRQRLLELFQAVGDTDPMVLKARRDLMTALF